MLKKDQEPEFPKVIETFCEPWRSSIHVEKEPSCFNSVVSVRRYRVTIEEIDEPREVIAARVLQLIHDCDNLHHYDPLKVAASKYDLDVDFCKEFGKNRKARKH